MTFGSINNLRAQLELRVDASNRVILSAGQDAFILGPSTSPANETGDPRRTFVPDAADELFFHVSQSLLSWPTPFQVSFLGGASPWWKRYVYYRLVWKKASGAKLDMLWRYEQQYYSSPGWKPPAMMWNSQTGLLSVNIRPESHGPEGAVVRYITGTRCWNRSEYDILHRRPSHDGQTDVFAVIYVGDALATAPGAGESVELYVDRAKKEVVRELGAQ